jgi:dimethylamine/trimethylamine dehydrogenase
VVDVREGGVTAFQHWAGRELEIACDGVVLVTQRLSDCSIYDELSADEAALEEAGIKGVFLIGDAEAPGFIAQAVFSGHRLAREIDTPDPAIALPFIRERRVLGSTEHDELLSNGALSTHVG